MGLFTKKPKENLAVLIDIRSSSIGAALAVISETDKPKILFTIREKVHFTRPQDSNTFIESMYTTLEKTLDTLHDKGLPKITHDFSKHTPFYVTYSSPWFISKTKSIHKKSQRPFLFTKKMFSKLSNVQEFFDNQKNIAIIENDITHVNVNGYELRDPYNKKVNEIDIGIYSAAISKKTKKAIQTIIKKKFHTTNISHRSQALTSFIALRNMFEFTNNFAFIDVGGEVTDVGIVEQQSMKHILSVPIGTHRFIRELHNQMKIDEIQARSILENYTDVKQTNAKSTEELMSVIGKIWSDAVVYALKDLNNPLPRNIFISADHDIVPFFKEIVETSLFEKGPAEKKNIHITTLSHEHLDHLFTYEKKVTHDTYIELQVIFLDSLIKNNYNI